MNETETDAEYIARRKQQYRARQKVNQLAVYVRRKAAGLCVVCESPTVEDGLKCVVHVVMHRQAQRTMKDRRRARGLCMGCGRVRVSRYLRCMHCRQARLQADARRR